jgi:hypothetical protein
MNDFSDRVMYEQAGASHVVRVTIPGPITRRIALLGAAIFLIGLFPSAASAELRWRGRTFDARELPTIPGCPATSPCYGFDIRTVTVKIRDADNGRAYLTITLRSFTPHGGFASGVALDTRHGPRADFRAYLDQARLAEQTLRGPGPARCGVRGAHPDSHIRLGVFRKPKQGSVATCRLPLRWVRPTHSIRWRVWTEDLFPQPYSTHDVSPDRSLWSG